MLSAAHDEASPTLARLRRPGGVAGMAAAALFTLGWIVAGLLEPGYNWTRQDISDLTAATAENPWVFGLAEPLAGILLLVFAAGLFGAVGDRWSGRIGTALLAVFAAAEVAVGAYLHLDCSLAEEACRQAEHTTRHELHGGLAGVSILALLAAIFLLARRFRREDSWRPLGKITLIADAAVVAFLVLYMLFAWQPGGGIAQRLAITTVLGWIAFVGYRLASRPSAENRQGRRRRRGLLKALRELVAVSERTDVKRTGRSPLVARIARIGAECASPGGHLRSAVERQGRHRARQARGQGAASRA